MFGQLKFLFRATLWITFSVVTILTVAAEDSPWFARTWMTEHGLPDNNVTGVAQSADGYLWIGTHNGLARFDGLQFQRIQLPAIPSRSDMLIRTMLLDGSDNLWLAAEGGVVIELSRNRTNVLTTADGLPNFRPTSLAADQAGGIWIGYVNGWVCNIAHGVVKHLSGPPGNGPCSVAADAAGNIWFSKGGNIGVFRTNEFVALPNFTEPEVRFQAAHDGGMWIIAGLRLLKFKEDRMPVELGRIAPNRTGVVPSVMFEDKQGALWVGTTAGGLFCFDGTNMVSVETSHSDVLSIGQDREGSIWLGTGGGGLNRLRPRVLELQGLESGLPAEALRSVCEDASGTVWATSQNGGLKRQVNGKWKFYSAVDGWTGGHATCVTSDGRDGVWIGTRDGFLVHWQNDRFTYLGPADGLASKTVNSLFQDSKGNLWIGLTAPSRLQCLSNGKLTDFTQPPGSRSIRAFAEDARGGIWAGTFDGYLLRVDGNTIADETARTISPRRPIRCLHAPTGGGLMIGYAGSGIGWLHDGKFDHVDSSRGLFDDGICEMVSDDAGSLWIGSDHGIFQVSLKELERAAADQTESVHSIVYGRDESLPNLQASYGYAPGALRSRDGRIWFTMRTGMAVVHPGRVRVNRIPPVVQIQRVLVDGREQSLSPEDPLRLPPSYRKIEIGIAALSFVAPENVRWKYRLNEVDNDWVAGGGQRSANYGQLPAGRYHFFVTACNSAGVWNDAGAQLEFTVDPFYWQTWWFRLSAVGAFTFGVVVLVRYVFFRRLRARMARMEQEAVLQRDRARIAQDLHDDLGSSLTHIALLSELAQNDLEQPRQARLHIDEIFRTARVVTRSLDEIVWSVNPKNDSLDRFVAHLSTYMPDFLRAAGVRVRLDMPEELPEMQLPSEVRHHLYLAIKEALHNIVKHASATEVWLRLRHASNTLTVTIEDDGRGFEAGTAFAPGADGLANFQQRMDTIGGRCEQKSRPGRGSIISFTVPISPNGN